MENPEPAPEPPAEQPSEQPSEPPSEPPMLAQPEAPAKKPRVTRKKKETDHPPPNSHPAPVQVDARFFAGLSTTLKQMNRAERVQRLSSFAVA